jgi:hypothetical protein
MVLRPFQTQPSGAILNQALPARGMIVDDIPTVSGPGELLSRLRGANGTLRIPNPPEPVRRRLRQAIHGLTSTCIARGSSIGIPSHAFWASVRASGPYG